ncbi:class I SAM-dependent methyltransferase [Chromatocurvus halotolerans]|uniref:Methyltransferase family protein n=1 Tax=Chromatocurvus halotolerans TaxID=1132028 RepID=A0A4R2KPM7_9GAMM|nr:class I SAM-dependent methyltransferase [Chromatocurvus halotolerans]TCO75524.1 methyltransferase family protein [Chromatocurvus halotolerans]
MKDELLARSSAHWSEARRPGMEAFYTLATDDYRYLAEARDWATWLAQAQASAGERSLRLLDVACGSGKFPNALVRHAGIAARSLPPIITDLLDPSAFSIAEARAALPLPFTPADEHEVTLQDFDPPPEGYDIVWATHALYAVPRQDLQAACAKFCAAIGNNGQGIIAHSAAAGHYVEFHRRFLAAFGKGDIEPYVSAEQLAACLRASGARVDVTDICYDTIAHPDATGAVEGYLQRCVFDDSVPLSELLSRSPTSEWLADCQTTDGWRFPQVAHLLDVTL